MTACRPPCTGRRPRAGRLPAAIAIIPEIVGRLHRPHAGLSDAWLHALARVLVGKPASTSPAHALAFLLPHVERHDVGLLAVFVGPAVDGPLLAGVDVGQDSGCMRAATI